MMEHILNLWPLLLALVVYFVRLETRLTKICTDLGWIKKYITACQQHSDQNTQ